MTPPSSLHRLFTAIARAVHSEQRERAQAAGLLPVHWSILAYLRDANRYSNTPQVLAEYLSLTKGTVSQSLRLLEAQGWITRQTDPVDRRVVRLMLTEKGLAQVVGIVSTQWQEAIDGLSADERDAMESTLARLLTGWQRARGGRTFGVCSSCRHFCPGVPEHRCGLTGEVLSEEDSGRICREHESK